MATPMVRPEASGTVNPVTIVLYSQTFVSGSIDGWTALNANSTVALAGNELGISSTLAGATVGAQRVVSGFTPGENYTFTAWFTKSASAATVSLGVSGIGSSTPVNPPSFFTIQVTYSFTATARSHTMIASGVSPSTGTVGYFDDFIVERSGGPGPATIALSEAAVILDEGWAPYAQGTTVLPNTEYNVGKVIDPRTATRVTLSAAEGPLAYTAWAEASRNRAPIPQATTSWAVVGGTTGVGGIIADARFSGGNARTITWATAGTGSYTTWAAAPTFVAGEKWFLSVKYAVTGGGTFSYVAIGGGAGVTYTTDTYTDVTDADGTHTIWMAVTITAGGVGIPILVCESPSGAGSIRIGNAMIVRGATAFVAYFDGSTTPEVPDALVRTRWVGATNGSESVRETRSATGSLTSRTFDLGVRSRSIDHVAKTTTLTLASDEAILQDYAKLVDDYTPRTYAADLRSLVNYVLSVVIPGKALESTPSVTADLTPYWELTNLVPNPNAATDITNFIAASGMTLAYNSGAGALTGNGFLRATMTGTTGSLLWQPDNTRNGSDGAYAVVPGQSYAASCYVRKAVAGGTALVMAQWFNSQGVAISPFSGSGPTTLTTSFQRISRVFVAPAGAAKVAIATSVSGVTSGQTVDVDCFMLARDTELQPFFDGATTDSATYLYDWSGAANGSPSARVPVEDRPRELFTWTAGTSAWDFLQPLITAAGLRLFCDEQRKWRLVSDAYTVAGTVTVTGDTAVDAVDTIDRDGDALWAQGVVVRYTWEDAETGILHTRTDSAGTVGKVLVVEYDQTYPGPGAAAHILQSMVARGRIQSGRALVNYGATPGQASVITLPGAATVSGRVKSVSFNLAEGLMQVDSKEQV